MPMMTNAASLPDYESLMKRTDAPPGSSWGLFGPDDELGTLNFQTPDRIRTAAACIRRGAVFSLDCPLDAFDPPTSHQRETYTHTIFGNNPHHRDDFIDGFYLQSGTQIDSLRHMRHPIHGFYNGAADDSIAVGTDRNGIGRWADHGIAGRGVLIDLDRHFKQRGRPIDQDSNQPFGAADLEEAMIAQGVELRPGDMLLLRTGWLDFYFRDLDPARRRTFHQRLRSPGLLQSRETLAWLWDHQISLVAADNPGVEAIPPVSSSPFAAELEGVPGVSGEMQPRLMHPQMIALLGMVLGELWDLERLAQDCVSDGVWDFFLTVKPLNLRGGVGSPANATAIK